MRQVGILGAAGHFVLEHNISRLADDHRHAKLLAETIHKSAPTVIDPNHVQTNIVGLNLKNLAISSSELADATKKENVLISVLGPKYARLVTHLDVDESEINTAAEIISTILKSRSN